jgi:hypothetical protein
MMRTILILLAALVMSFGCGEAGSQDYQPKETKRVNTAAEERGATGAPKPPESPVVGETLDYGEFEFRVLSVTKDKHWFYPETETGFGSQEESLAGEFVTIWYSVSNTGATPLRLSPGANLTVSSGETFALATAQCDELERLQPRELGLGCFVFDVPSDVEAESVWVQFRHGNLAPETFDLTRADSAAEADEILALQYEYLNCGYFSLAYDLFASESKAQFSEEQYVTAMSTGTSEEWKRYPVSDFAFPRVTVEGDHAEVERIITTYDNKNYASSQERRTQELIKEDGQWRIVARPEQVTFYTTG